MLTSIKIKKVGLQWIESAPVTWENRVDDLPLDGWTAYLVGLEDWLLSLSVRAARLSGYIFARSSGMGHLKAVEYSNKRVARVRKALGYTIAKDDLRF